LFDLVQLECLAGTHHVVRVISRSQTGYLYFHAGNLVHAVCRSLQGEAAAIEILSWENGLFEPCDIPWPSIPSITKPWQNLLLLAAQMGDESRRASTGGKVLEFPSGGPSVSNDPSSNIRPASGETTGVGPVTNGHSSSLGSASLNASSLNASGLGAPVLSPPRVTPALSSPAAKPPSIANTLVQAAVRLDASGNVLTSRGNGQELVGAVTYAARVAQLIADSLGLGDLKGIELETERYKSFVHRESDGQLLAVRANRDVDLSTIKGKLGL
jgi:hypothetical protein